MNFTDKQLLIWTKFHHDKKKHGGQTVQVNRKKGFIIIRLSVIVPPRIEGLILFMRTLSYQTCTRYSWNSLFCLRKLTYSKFGNMNYC